MTLAMLIDLGFGIKKAKQLGLYTTSTGFKRTTEKAMLYYGVLLTVFIIDVICNIAAVYMDVFKYPLLSVLWSIYIIGTEAYSMYEKADEKMRHKKERQAKELLDVVTKVSSELKKLSKDE